MIAIGTIYQLTFFFAVALLAIVITIFVFAVSLLGRAIEAAARSETDKLAERKANNIEEMASIRKEIEEAEASGQIPKGLTRKLDKLEKNDKKFEKELGKIRKAPESLTVRGGVFYPCAFLIAALVLCGVAFYLSNVENIKWTIPLFIWILSLAAVGYSIYRICKSLRVIQSVAIPSEETAFKRETQAFKAALKEIEEEKKPKLVLWFIDTQPPFHVKTGAQMTINFGLQLTQGDLARKPIVYFFAPSGFDFPGNKTWIQHKDVSTVGGYITISVEFDECRLGMGLTKEVAVKVSPKTGAVSLWYKINCEGFDSGLKECKFVIE